MLSYVCVSVCVMVDYYWSEISRYSTNIVKIKWVRDIESKYTRTKVCLHQSFKCDMLLCLGKL